VNELSDRVAFEAHDLTVAYRGAPVLYGVDLTIEAGQMVGVVGPNGAGKSTLIKAAMGLVEPHSGWVKFFGASLKQTVRRVGYVPQRGSVDWDFPVNARDVVLMGRYGRRGVLRRPSAQDEAVADACLEKVKMGEFGRRQISQLSGGQQQRIFLARALAQEADIYLMDEPFVGVDAATESAIVEVLRELRDQGKTLIVVHHDLSSARDYFDSVVLLNMRVIAHGPIGEVFNFENLQAAYGGQLTILSEVAARRDSAGR